MLPASPRRQGVSSVHHNGTEALIRHLHKASYYVIHPRRFARIALYERSCFWRITTQPHPRSRTCSSSTPHLMGYGPGRPVKTRGRPHGHGGRRISSSRSTPHLMVSGPGRSVKPHGPPHGPGGAAHIEPTSHGQRPGPAHQMSRGWAAARPGPSKFQRMGRGPAWPIKISEDGSRPGPAHHIFNFSQPDPARPINFSKISARSGLARPGPS